MWHPEWEKDQSGLVITGSLAADSDIRTIFRTSTSGTSPTRLIPVGNALYGREQNDPSTGTVDTPTPGLYPCVACPPGTSNPCAVGDLEVYLYDNGDGDPADQ